MANCWRHVDQFFQKIHTAPVLFVRILGLYLLDGLRFYAVSEICQILRSPAGGEIRIPSITLWTMKRIEICQPTILLEELKTGLSIKKKFRLFFSSLLNVIFYV